VLSSNPKSLDGLYAFARAMARGDRIGARAPREQPSRGGDLIDVDRQATSSVVSLLRCMLGAYPSTLSVQSYMPPSHLLPIRAPYLPTRVVAAASAKRQEDLKELSKLQARRSSNTEQEGNNSNSDVSYYRLVLVSGEKQILSKHLEALQERLSRWERRDKRPRRTRPTPPKSEEL